jgi:hypothetical protein
MTFSSLYLQLSILTSTPMSYVVVLTFLFIYFFLLPLGAGEWLDLGENDYRILAVSSWSWSVWLLI